jgi:hypothetical protein
MSAQKGRLNVSGSGGSSESGPPASTEVVTAYLQVTSCFNEADQSGRLTNELSTDFASEIRQMTETQAAQQMAAATLMMCSSACGAAFWGAGKPVGPSSAAASTTAQSISQQLGQGFTPSMSSLLAAEGKELEARNAMNNMMMDKLEKIAMQKAELMNAHSSTIESVRDYIKGLGGGRQMMGAIARA